MEGNFRKRLRQNASLCYFYGMEKTPNPLAAMEYPGRVIVIGLDPSGRSCVVAYAVTGRSPSSQARRLEFAGGKIWTRPTDEEILKKGTPDLLVYPAVIISAGIAVSNGKQTEDIAVSLLKSQEPLEVLRLGLAGWSFEPDAPIYTPRISGCILPGPKAALSIIKRSGDESAERAFFPVSLIPGKGKMISTYSGENQNPLRSFEGEPKDIGIPANEAKAMTEYIYEALKPRLPGSDFRVAAACVFADRTDLGRFDVSIINRHEREEKHG